MTFAPLDWIVAVAALAICFAPALFFAGWLR